MSSSITITKTISQRRRSWGKGRTMAGESQKLKLLNLAKMLYERTDESHGLTCPEIIAGLAEAGIEAERKSVYRDLDALRDFGLDIAKLPTYPVSYALVSRTFTAAELMLLTDAVQSSRFLTVRMAHRLTEGLASLGSCHQAAALSKNVHVEGRIKMQNESVFHHVDTLHEAIREERNRLMPLRETANHLIDTSNLRPRALQKMLKEIVFSAGTEPPLRVEVLSFGFKRGIPREGDLVFDVRFLPNPFYIPELGSHTGLDQDVKDFVLEHPVTKEFLVKCMDMLQFLLPHYITEGKHRLVIAIGCTGGAHRSVAIAEYISARLEELGYHTTVNHRDIALEQAHWETKSEYQKGEP